jgi:hypothetical protein
MQYEWLGQIWWEREANCINVVYHMGIQLMDYDSEKFLQNGRDRKYDSGVLFDDL